MRENGKALINLRKAGNDDMDVLKVQSIKNSKSVLECPAITALVTFDAKTFNDTELLKSCLAGRDRVIKVFQANQTKTPRLTVWQNTWPTFFISFTSVFSYL